MDTMDKLKSDEVSSKGYGIIYKMPMLDTDLDVVAKAFYAYLCSYAGAGDTAFPGMDKICNDLQVSRQRLERHRKVLVDKGYITVKQVKGEKGRFKHNEYLINKELSPLLRFPTTDEPTTENVTTNNNSLNNNNNNINNNTSPKVRMNSKKDKYDSDSPYIKMAEYMYSLIVKNNDSIKKPNMQKWADDFRKMIEIDERPKEIVGDVLRFAVNDSFWQSNILSPSKLRKQYSVLYGQMNRGVKKTENNKPSSALNIMLENALKNYDEMETKNERENKSNSHGLYIPENGSTF
jgi:hypothetical protein